MPLGPCRSLATALCAVVLLGLWAAGACAEETPKAISGGAPTVVQPPPELPATPPPVVTGAEATQEKGPAPPPNFVSGKNIGDKLREAKQERSSMVNFGIRDALNRADAYVYKHTRIRFSGIYTLLYQHASDGNGPRDAVGGDFDLIGTWDAIQDGDRTTGSLEAAFEGRHRMGTDITPSQLSTTLDSLWSTTSGFNEQPFSLTQFYWLQSLLDDRLHFRVGKLSGYSSFFGNRINSSSLYFANYAFSDNPAVFFPGNGLGFHVAWEFAPRWTAVFGVQDANGKKTELDPTTLRYGEFWYATQLQYRMTLRGLGEGTIRVGGWYVDGRTPADSEPGTGAVLSIDQELGSHLISFLRYEYQGQSLITPEVQFNALTGTETALRGGLGIKSLLRAFPDDFMGIGAAWGVPSKSRPRDAYVGEIFYRSQIESAMQLTLSLQLIRSSTIFDEVFVVSIRFRIQV